MNVLLNPDSSAVKQWGLSSIVFITLIQDYTVSSTGRIFSSYTESLLKRKLNKVPLLMLRGALKELEQSGMLQIQGSRIQIGDNSDLYANVNADNENFERADDIAKRLRSLQNARIRGVDSSVYYTRFRKLREQERLNVTEFLSLYRCVYFAIAEELPTDFAAKEKGQMGHLVTYYGTGNRLRNIISEYIYNSDKYTKDFISIGGLLHARHKIEGSLKKQTTKIIKKGIDDEF